jgi:hypothetical protein
MNGNCKGDLLLRNILLSKELLVVLCFVFWFWLLSFSLLLLLVHGSFGYRHNMSDKITLRLVALVQRMDIVCFLCPSYWMRVLGCCFGLVVLEF